jgi:hypothetical protein
VHLLAPVLNVRELIVLLVPFVGYVVMVLAPRSRPPDSRRVLWLAGIATLVAAEVWLSHPALELPTLLLLGAACAGLVVLPVNPRLAIACGIVLTVAEVSRWTLTSHALTSAPVSWLAAAGPVVLAACVLRLRSARRQSSV